MTWSGPLLRRTEVLGDTSTDVVGEGVRRMGSTICPSRERSADLDWTVLHAARTAPFQGAAGTGRGAVGWGCGAAAALPVLRRARFGLGGACYQGRQRCHSINMGTMGTNQRCGVRACVQCMLVCSLNDCAC